MSEEKEHQITSDEAVDRAAHGSADDATLIESLCVSLNDAHSFIIKLQDENADPSKFDWPEWSGPANSIRAAEKRLGKRLAKTVAWTMYPPNDGTQP